MQPPFSTILRAFAEERWDLTAEEIIDYIGKRWPKIYNEDRQECLEFIKDVRTYEIGRKIANVIFHIFLIAVAVAVIVIWSLYANR